VNEEIAGYEQEWPANGLEVVDRCPVCGEGEREILHQGLRDQVFYCAPGEWTLYCCRGCCSAYLDPRPTAETIYLAYRKYYTHQLAGDFHSPCLPRCVERLRMVSEIGGMVPRIARQIILEFSLHT
jgi:hypothetical protein